MKFLTALLCLITLRGFSQDISHLASGENEWFEGSIFLTDNSEIKGLLQYSDKTGILKYQNGNQSKSFTSRGVLAFEFFDAAQAEQRIFYSIEYEVNKTLTKRPYFFEVIKDNGTFALVSKTDPIEFKGKETFIDRITESSTLSINNNNNSILGNVIPKSLHLYQLETVYLFDFTKESITPIIEISNKETDGFFMIHQKLKIRW
jgi:hypothetical protein